MEDDEAHKDPTIELFRRSLEDLESSRGFFRAALYVSTVQEFPKPAGWEAETFSRLEGLIVNARHALTLPPEGPRGAADLDAFVHWFTDEERFHGNRESYQDPLNSCLDAVLERRMGLPITLSVLFVTIAREAGFEAYGVGAPGHFLVGIDLPSDRVYLSPFDGALMMDRDNAAEYIAQLTGLDILDVRPTLRRTPADEIIGRMLNNLKVAYANDGDIDRLLRTLDYLLELTPDNLTELRNRGLILLRKGEKRRGAEDLLRYIRRHPEPDDLEIISREARRALDSE